MFAAFLRPGLTPFGGPIAHLGYFRDEFVGRRGWLRDDEYAELVAICQFLPGPASSRVGMAIGLQRAGLPGALAAWAGFTLPAADDDRAGEGSAARCLPAGVVQGPKLVAMVAHAVWGMARSFYRSVPAVVLMPASAAVLLA